MDNSASQDVISSSEEASDESSVQTDLFNVALSGSENLNDVNKTESSSVNDASDVQKILDSKDSENSTIIEPEPKSSFDKSEFTDSSLKTSAPQNESSAAVSNESSPVFEDSKTVLQNKDSKDLNVLVNALQHVQNNAVTSLSRKSDARYSGILTSILKPESVESSVLPEHENIVTASNISSIQSNPSAYDAQENGFNEVFNYIYDIKQKALTLVENTKNSLNQDSSQSHIESISSAVTQINRFTKENADDSSPSADVLSAISKLPSFDQNGNIVDAPKDHKEDATPVEEVPFDLNDGNSSIQNPAAENKSSEEQKEDLSPDELLKKVQEEAINMMMADPDLNQRLLAQGSELNKKAHISIKPDDEADIRREFNKDLSLDSQMPAEITVSINLNEEKHENVSEADYSLMHSLDDVLKEVLKKQSRDPEIPVIKARSYSKELFDAVTQSLNESLCIQNQSQELSDNSIQQVTLSEAEYVDDMQSPQNAFDENTADYTQDVPYTDEIVSDASLSTAALNVAENRAVIQQSDNTLIDGNPKVFKESTLKVLEEDNQFENRRLGRQLEPKDFYPKVLETSLWYQEITAAGYNDGPVYSALCYSNRTYIRDDKYSWKLEVSKDFEILIQAPEFAHNLQTKFSILLKHPVNLQIEAVNGIPRDCPEDQARRWYLKEIENARIRIRENERLKNLLSGFGDDPATVCLSLYTQEALPQTK